MEGSERFAPGAVVAGKLRIVRQLGEGGMGAVFEVEHELTRHRRALKLLHAQMARVPSVVERFLREASAAGRIGNPHIVETFDAGRLETGEPYIVMELLRGKTLAELLEQDGPLEFQTACKLMAQACDAVNAAHKAGIVHRDLKPENLFLCGPNLDFVKILDFGVSKFSEEATGVQGLTMEGSPIGTPYYMSPEQVRGEKSIDARADVYALGVLFYECLTGRKPFVAETLPHLAVLIYEGKCDPPSQLRPGITPDVDNLVARAMANERQARFSTALELSAAVQEALQTHVRSQPPPATLEVKAAVPGVIPVAISDVTQASEGQRRGISAMTPAVFTSQQPASSVPQAKSGKGIWIAALAVLGLAGGVGIWWTQRGAAPTANPEQPGLSQSSPALVESPRPPEVTPVPLPAVASPSASPAASVSAATSVEKPRLSAPVVPLGSAKRPGGTPTRAGQHGLSQDNPFK